MSTEFFNEETNEVINKFNRFVDDFYKQIETEFDEYKNDSDNKDLLKCFKRKYKFLNRYKISKKTKINECKALIHELCDISTFKEDFSDSDFKIICEYCISKIRGLYKHAQALKTAFCNGQIITGFSDVEEKKKAEEGIITKGFCNGQIITGFSEENTVSICVTKNTLEANGQWLSRLFKELDNRYPQVKLNDKIMIISSQKNTLDGNATHCKNIDVAWSYLKKSNKFKIVFICSNKIRIQDIFEMAVSFLNLKEVLRKNLRILHDEAHNTKEGIPPFRHIIENIIVLPNVLSYEPITASLGKIVDSNNPLWIKKNLERTAINFTDFDNTKSDDPKYSSVGNYKKFNFEELKLNPKWFDYNRTEISTHNFVKVDDKYKHKSLDTLTQDDMEDIERRKQLEFCQFMKSNKEIEALNNGLNSLNLNELLKIDYFIKDTFNLHIISTPNRKVITHELCIEAIKQNYAPIVLGIYGNQGDKYHLFIHGEETKCVDEIMGEGEFNCKLFNLIKHLNSKEYNTERPFIIIGNYTPTGESLSYVNYEYGTVRGVIRLISTNAEEDYQSVCRGNYMNTKFLEHNSKWTPPDKFLIGHTSFIENALSYEAENDARIDAFNVTSESDSNHIILPSPIPINNINGTTATPIKIKLDISHPKIKELIDIASKSKRKVTDKIEFLKKLQVCCEDPEIECEFTDKSLKFDWTNMELVDFRCYKQKDKPPTKGNWKFKNYQTNFRTEKPFINYTSNHKAGQCEILVCKDFYIIKNKDNEVIEKNFQSEWWIGYKY